MEIAQKRGTEKITGQRPSCGKEGKKRNLALNFLLNWGGFKEGRNWGQFSILEYKMERKNQ